jgi:hypothetical protein
MKGAAAHGSAASKGKKEKRKKS